MKYDPAVKNINMSGRMKEVSAGRADAGGIDGFTGKNRRPGIRRSS